MKKKLKKPDQIPHVLEVIRSAIENRKYFQTTHALERLDQREIDLFDVLYVLKNGYHEKRKTSFDEAFQKWKYAIRGNTSENHQLRIIVTIESNGVLIITAIDLTKE